MQYFQSSLIARSDTMFGVCQALGNDFGISANWLRIAFAAGVIYNLEWALAAYVVVGLVVGLAHLIHPNPRRAVAAEPVAERPALEASTDMREPELVAA